MSKTNDTLNVARPVPASQCGKRTRTQKATPRRLQSPTSAALQSAGAFLDSAVDGLAQAAVELAALARSTDGRTAATLALDLRKLASDAHAVAEIVNFWHTHELIALRQRAEQEESEAAA